MCRIYRDSVAMSGSVVPVSILIKKGQSRDSETFTALAQLSQPINKTTYQLYYLCWKS